jgi:hypothetical protein
MSTQAAATYDLKEAIAQYSKEAWPTVKKMASIGLIGGLSVSLITAINPFLAAAFIATAIAISKMVKPIIDHVLGQFADKKGLGDFLTAFTSFVGGYAVSHMMSHSFTLFSGLTVGLITIPFTLIFSGIFNAFTKAIPSTSSHDQDPTQRV